MDKEQFLKLLKELFKEGRIEIVNELYGDLHGRYLGITVKIDGKEIYHNKADY
jgi:hypothetical protein